MAMIHDRSKESPGARCGVKRMFRHTGPMRRAVASLELIMVLPVLMFIATVIINVGNATTWKVRSISAARDSAMRVRWPRSGWNPRPAGWPEPGTMGNTDVESLAVLDEPAHLERRHRRQVVDELVAAAHVAPLQHA